MSRSPQMSVIRAVIADFPFDGYGIDLGGADPAWVGDLAAAITGALTVAGEGDGQLPEAATYATTRGEPGDGA